LKRNANLGFPKNLVIQKNHSGLKLTVKFQFWSFDKKAGTNPKVLIIPVGFG